MDKIESNKIESYFSNSFDDKLFKENFSDIIEHPTNEQLEQLGDLLLLLADPDYRFDSVVLVTRRRIQPLITEGVRHD
ncbi:hypothetical protein G7081_00330 [Vagococcus coleopterorum]|uniref:Uncharacterized protein n=1 Tax=Vagococcus coleopterorum TaxID=2714946 RepID=A0A6G8AKP5_9ENTE|nr:hypothetical protein [Vagococcus coleopterorum]QIL45641.1 hypothetical protein G7081_00330 [Vagococcus coleopterorum]